MGKKISSILKEVLIKINPSKEELSSISGSIKEASELIEQKLKESDISAEIFIGGSYAKGTMIRKDHYEVDLFLRLEKKYIAEISSLINNLSKKIENSSVIHGSRDYLKIIIGTSLYIELVPVLKIKKPKEAENITDLSYSHVRYVRKKIKLKKLLDDIKLAKAFCYANKCYGAESYINGFSGYALELLIYYYGGFLNFIRGVLKLKSKEVIDIEKHYKSRKLVFMDLNSSKLKSPAILIDPTYKQRNVLAALSEETLEKFKEACKEFLANPSIKSFEQKKTDMDGIKRNAQRKKYEFVVLEAETLKQEGDIAGSKLLKFYKHLSSEINNFFYIKEKDFDYGGGKSARYFFAVKSRGEILIHGPKLTDKKNMELFKKKHNKNFEKKGKIYAKEKPLSSISEFIKKWKEKNNQKIRDMSISNLKLIP